MPAGRRARRSLGSSVVLSYISVRKACSGDFAHDLGSDHHVDHNPAGRGDRNRWRGTLGIAVYPVAHATSSSPSPATRLRCTARMSLSKGERPSEQGPTNSGVNRQEAYIVTISD